MNKLLEVRNLSLTFSDDDNPVLKNVNLEVKNGQKVGLVGESGSGKTTLGLSISRLLPSKSKILGGEIFFNDSNILTLSEKDFNNLRGNEISIIFQDPMNSLNPLMKIGNQVIEIITKNLKIDKKSAKNLVLSTFESIGLKDPEYVYNSYRHQISGGMCQRILISMAIICKPKFLIADEPTTALDVTIQKQIIEILNKLSNENNMSLLFISHDLAIINNISDYIYVIYKGVIVEHGKKENIMFKCKHPYTKQLINSIPKMENKGKKLSVSNRLEINNLDYKEYLCPFRSFCPNKIDYCYKQMPDELEIENEHYVRCFNY